jgi:hypothetical protein
MLASLLLLNVEWSEAEPMKLMKLPGIHGRPELDKPPCPRRRPYHLPSRPVRLLAHRWPGGPSALPILQGRPDRPGRRMYVEPLHLLPRALRLLPLDVLSTSLSSYILRFLFPKSKGTALLVITEIEQF